MVLNDIQNAYVGSAPVSAIYLGDTLIWPQTPLFVFIDLDLPSGTLWAQCNVGADTETDAGKYFQWGDIEGNYESGLGTTREYSWATAPFNDSQLSYCKSAFNRYIPTITTNLILNADYDAVTLQMGIAYKMPTDVDFQELIDNTTHQYLENFNHSGMNGFVFKSKIDNSKYIFIPAVGICNVWSILNMYVKAFYWASNFNNSDKAKAFNIDGDYGSDDLEVLSNDRFTGAPIRGIEKPLSSSYRLISVGESPNVPWNTFTANIDFVGEVTFLYSGKPSKTLQFSLIQRVTFEKNWPTPRPSYQTGTDYVDLNLPSGTKWAKCNVGSMVESGYGLYFQWGDIDGYQDPTVLDNPITRTGTFQWHGVNVNWSVNQGAYGNEFTWDYYKFYKDGLIIKYTEPYDVLESGDDAATQIMGPNFRMPTDDEMRELWNNTDRTKMQIDGIWGYKFASKTNPSNFIFMPFGGVALNKAAWYAGEQGHYWSSVLYSSGDVAYAFGLRLNTNDYYEGVYYNELVASGKNIRAVYVGP